MNFQDLQTMGDFLTAWATGCRWWRKICQHWVLIYCVAKVLNNRLYWVKNYILTERRGRLVNTPLYLRGPRFKSRSGNRLSWLKFFLVSHSPSTWMPGYSVNWATDRLFPNTLLFIIHLSCFHSTLISVAEKASLNKLQNKQQSFVSLTSYVISSSS
jgi:hypothetical protein